jgi:colanic acid/amylovoran biosynthesis protein
MTILVDNGTYALENMGDVIMLQACVTRLRGMWPHATIGVFTRRPDRLARYCPDAVPVNALGRDQFIAPGGILGKLHRFTAGLEHAMRRSAPGVCGRVVAARAKRHNMPEADVPAFAGMIQDADLLVTAGGGYITDEFPSLAERILTSLALAQDMGKRTAMLGQGLGPLDDPKLRALATRALRRLDLLTLREGRANFALLESLGVPPARAVVTGDDAVEASGGRVPASLGGGLGVNLRTTRYSGAGDETVATLRPILHDAAARHGAPLVPVPISFNDAGEDVRVLRALLGRDVAGDDSVQSPQHTVAAAASCRILVTGAYHAAVFALSNGVSAVALAGSQYYVNKFEGLREQFDGRLEIVRLHQCSWPGQLRGKIGVAWESAEQARPALLAAARRQARLGRDAYARMAEWFASPRQPIAA